MNHTHDAGHHDHTIMGELTSHLPYAIFSVAVGLIILSFATFFSFGETAEVMCTKADILFHSFHFIHIVFAATGTLITFFRFSHNMAKALIVGVISPAIFCTLSDSVLPYIDGQILGIKMHFHLCFISELPNVIPFLLVGILNGFVLSFHKERQWVYSVASHAVHILISSLAAIFYLVSHGCTDWYLIIGPVFLFLIFAVVVPCTLSDVVVPMLIARAGTKHEKH